MPQRSNSARYLWGDRNPATKHMQYANTVAPHGGTVRGTYTVPTGKKAQIQNYYAHAAVNTAATSTATRALNMHVVSGGVTVTVCMAEVFQDRNVVGNVTDQAVGLSTTMLAGDVVNMNTWDDSTGGTVEYIGGITIVEYDA